MGGAYLGSIVTMILSSLMPIRMQWELIRMTPFDTIDRLRLERGGPMIEYHLQATIGHQQREYGGPQLSMNGFATLGHRQDVIEWHLY